VRNVDHAITLGAFAATLYCFQQPIPHQVFRGLSNFVLSGQDFTVLEEVVDDAQPVSEAESKGSKAEKRLQRQVPMQSPASHGVCPSESHQFMW
jgi:hypothetical protein